MLWWNRGMEVMAWKFPLFLDYNITCRTQLKHLVNPRHCMRIRSHRLIYVSTHHLFQCVPVVQQPDDRFPADAPHDKIRWHRRTDTMCKIVRVLTIASVTFPLCITMVRTNSYTAIYCAIYFTGFNSEVSESLNYYV